MSSDEEASAILGPAGIRHLLERGRSSPRVGDCLGPYRLVAQIGRGGMGVVFEAVHPAVEHRVAVKVMLGGLANETTRRSFIAEAEKQLQLRHPGIVPVLHVDATSVPAFFTMPLYRQSLATALRDLPVDWKTRTKMMVAIARAIQHAHDRGLLHHDLKPANILLDGSGEPLVADFGLARRRDEAGSGEPGEGGGTLAYMAPEQAAGGTDFTVAADVFGLGAILYELLTGELPFGRDPEEIRRRMAQGPPPAARRYSPRIPRDLDRVCMKSLAMRAGDRYPSAAALAADLESVLLGRAPAVAPASRWEQPIHAVRRNAARWQRGALVLGAALAVVFVAESARREALREERVALDTNAFIASGQAGAILFQLREMALRVQLGARDPAITALAEPTMAMTTSEGLVSLARGFDAAYVLDDAGHVKAQWPQPLHDVAGRTYAFRDYFRGARSLVDSNPQNAYVARAFRSERDDELKFGVSAPIERDGVLAGVVLAIVAADKVFGRVRMQDEGQSGRTTALLGPRDLDRGDPPQWPPPDRFVFLIHDALGHGEEVAAPNSPTLLAAFRQAAPPGQQFSLRYVPPLFDADYVDPLRGPDAHWRASFAPVGGTGYVVVVQSRRATPIAVAGFVSRIPLGALALALSAAVLSLGHCITRHMRSSERTRSHDVKQHVNRRARS